MSSFHVLVAERTIDALAGFRDALERAGHHCRTVYREAGMREGIAAEVPDVVVIDGGAGDDGRGLDMLERLKAEFEDLPVIVVTEKSPSAEEVVAAIRAGAFDVVPSDQDPAKLEAAVENAGTMHRLMIKVNQLQSHYTRRGRFEKLIGISPRMQAIYSIIENVGRTDVTVFITGESGTGKELIASALHACSARTGGPFVAVNAAAIPRDLLESELFGHEKGAFTGATGRYLGCCERAHRGTLFLDEICEMDVGLQSKLLRFLQERTFHRLGGQETISVDTRIVAATNRDPFERIEAGLLREDLYYRLNVVPIHVPPLRDRAEDIPVLAAAFLERLSSRYEKYFYDFEPAAMSALTRYSWPGNVREMENTIERIVVLHNGSRISARMLPERVLGGGTARRPETLPPAARPAWAGDDVIVPFVEVEKETIIRALTICRGNVSMAASRLELGQATLYRKIKKYGINRRELGAVSQ